jgi:hypothetical protein
VEVAPLSEHSKGSLFLGDIGFTSEEILQLCQAVSDPNPWHDVGVIPFYALLGKVSGAIFRSAREHSLLEDALVTHCEGDFKRTLRTDRIYVGKSQFALGDRHTAEVSFSVENDRQQEVASGLVIARYR